MDDPAILNVEPARLAVVTAEQTGPFRTFLREPLPAGLKPIDLAILNQVELDEEIARGTPLKLPR